MTGAGRGIGRAVAIGLASAGSAVGLVARSHDELAETARHAADTVTPRTISGLDEPATPAHGLTGRATGWWRGVLVPWPRQLPSLRSPSWPEWSRRRPRTRIKTSTLPAGDKWCSRASTCRRMPVPVFTSAGETRER